MSRVTRQEWYRRVNAAWPAVVPPLTAEEAVRAGPRLYRFVTGRTWSKFGEVRITSGNRYTWIRRGVMYVNPAQGWKGLVHLLSHRLDKSGSHGAEHARLELRMIKQVVQRGWLEGKLLAVPVERPAPSAADRAAERYARLCERTSDWERKQKRAMTALKKLARQRAYLERTYNLGECAFV